MTDAVARPTDDRWPDRFAAGVILFAALTFVVALVPPWRRSLMPVRSVIHSSEVSRRAT